MKPTLTKKSNTAFARLILAACCALALAACGDTEAKAKAEQAKKEQAQWEAAKAAHAKQDAARRAKGRADKKKMDEMKLERVIMPWER